jgi:hypothetical protein
MRASKQKIKRETGYLYYLGSDGYVWASPMRANPKGRKHKVGTENVERKPGHLYYIDKEGYVACVPQKRGRAKKMGAKIPTGMNVKAVNYNLPGGGKKKRMVASPKIPMKSEGVKYKLPKYGDKRKREAF